jgi:predicted RNA binding protein YcfA (HicA-like mRNA interferase family)
MSKREKLRQRLRNNPKDATLQQVETLLSSFGFSRVRIQGSHHIYEYDDGTIIKKVVVPVHGTKVKSVYVKRVIRLIDSFVSEENGDGTDA